MKGGWKLGVSFILGGGVGGIEDRFGMVMDNERIGFGRDMDYERMEDGGYWEDGGIW